MSALAYLADCEARNRHVAASEELSELERDGLVIIKGVGWGYRRVVLTDKGRNLLTKRESND